MSAEWKEHTRDSIAHLEKWRAQQDDWRRDADKRARSERAEATKWAARVKALDAVLAAKRELLAALDADVYERIDLAYAKLKVAEHEMDLERERKR